MPNLAREFTSVSPRTATIIRDSRAATEETVSDEDAIINEHHPLLPPSVRNATADSMRRSLTTFLTSSDTTSTFSKLTSYAECRGVRVIDVPDTGDTLSSSANVCPRHLTLFSSTCGKSIKETFL
ncbi:unnamed protein product [Angiostrongylus costaricensis]|uniref:Uncharacterized protein n=1 Tax=Angiostrongylus costaricensis TaxID=334426 RepID=A0A0R3PBE4_ANGCS|nr:unnamed protein product [Angiostrongylus costaricensis]